MQLEKKTKKERDRHRRKRRRVKGMMRRKRKEMVKPKRMKMNQKSENWKRIKIKMMMRRGNKDLREDEELHFLILATLIGLLLLDHLGNSHHGDITNLDLQHLMASEVAMVSPVEVVSVDLLWGQFQCHPQI